MCDFRRRKWQAPGTTNSVPKLQMVPRVSMICGLDSQGGIYFTLVQSNSNSKVMEIFFHALVKKLDKERPNWREDTIIMLDNATYHKSVTTLKLLQSLQVPTLYTGPHSYTAAPCELLFASYKSVDTNPNRVKTGKSHFKEVMKLAIRRFQ